MEGKFTLVIDGKECQAMAGQTILDVAKKNGIYIPTLCYFPSTTLVGACRVCVVEQEGARNLVASCAMPASPGMKIQTDTPRVTEARKMVVELIWSSGDHNCLQCESNGQCELQDLVYRLGIEKPRFEIDPPGYTLDTTNTMIQRDLNKCVLCGRCIRGCNEIQVNEVLDFAQRGNRMKVGPAFDQDYINSSCVFCGECLQDCPRGHHQQAGPLPGTPLGDREGPHDLRLLRRGLPIDLNVFDGKVVKVTSDRGHGAPNWGSLCVKGRFARRVHPLPRPPDDPAHPQERQARGGRSWDEALDYVAERLRRSRQHGPTHRRLRLALHQRGQLRLPRNS